MFVAEGRANAEKVGNALLASGYRGFDRQAVAYGDPDNVAEQLSVFKDLGFTDIIIRTMSPIPPEIGPDAATRSVELAADVRSLLASTGTRPPPRLDSPPPAPGTTSRIPEPSSPRGTPGEDPVGSLAPSPTGGGTCSARKAQRNDFGRAGTTGRDDHEVPGDRHPPVHGAWELVFPDDPTAGAVDPDQGSLVGGRQDQVVHDRCPAGRVTGHRGVPDDPARRGLDGHHVPRERPELSAEIRGLVGLQGVSGAFNVATYTMPSADAGGVSTPP